MDGFQLTRFIARQQQKERPIRDKTFMNKQLWRVYGRREYFHVESLLRGRNIWDTGDGGRGV